ncbi:hypothetical protein [Nocardiopsis sp. MG754419]|uniref:hypothetical protein n=1 Tax=Nocardiopsis sp. MG754419 TaxID=2259865 RepID=UPI002010E549|nr:hypothetical protein [Nocardiopsis sp. MG754419]
MGIVAAVVVILVFGWMALNAVLPDTTPVAAGRSVTVASDAGYDAKLTFEEGWELHQGSSTEGSRYQFSKGPVVMLLSVVTPPERVSETELWDGMRNLVRVGDSSASLTDPQPVTSEAGAEGLAGTLHSNQTTGTAALFPSPNGVFAVETTATSSAGESDLVDVEKLLQSLRFDRTEGGS